MTGLERNSYGDVSLSRARLQNSFWNRSNRKFQRKTVSVIFWWVSYYTSFIHSLIKTLKQWWKMFMNWVCLPVCHPLFAVSLSVRCLTHVNIFRLTHIWYVLMRFIIEFSIRKSSSVEFTVHLQGCSKEFHYIIV